MRLPRLRAVIFDFDGVLLDSNAVKTAAFREVFARYPPHADAMMAYHEAFVSQSRYEKFGYLVERLLDRPGDTVLVEQLAADFAGLLRDRMEACPFVPGAAELLEALYAHVPLYLASVTPEEELRRLLGVRGLTRYFAQVYGCPPWHKPDAVANIVAALGGAAGVVLVGDSAGDQRAAAAHGVEFIARDSGLPFDPPLRGTPDMHDIASVLKARLQA